ncbi:MAG: ABC transporter ATP-binding protein [Desulfobacterales bacterium]|nr:ABC transporter ATP-binding protein [Desulfobacterales bacterium]
MILKVTDLNYSRKQTPILSQINFSLDRGEVLAVLGPNGAGKTTLLKCLNRILPTPRGRVSVAGTDLATLSPRQIARRIAHVAQENQTAAISAFDAVLMGRLPHMGARPTPRDLKKVNGIMDQLQLSALALTPLDQMSGGERQKVCIARALAQETDLLLMDEPTANLDMKNQSQVLELVRHIVTAHGMAAVLTLHDLNAALAHAHRIIFLARGKILAQKRVDDITADLISRVYDMDVDVIHHRGRPLVIPRKEVA